MTNQLVKFDKLAAEVSIIIEPIFSVGVADKTSSDKAMETLKVLNTLSKTLESDRDSMVRPLNEQVKEINAGAKKIEQELEKGKLYLKDKLRAFEMEQAKIRAELIRQQEEEKRKKEELARKEAEAEKERIRKEKEAADAEAALLSQFFEEPVKVEVSQEEQNAQKRLEIEQQLKEERTKEEIAKQHKEAIRAIESDKLSGARKVWKFEIVDSSLIPRNFLVPDEKLIRTFVNAGTREIPGVKIYEDLVVVTR